MNYAIPGASRYRQVNTNPWMQALQNYSAADISEMNWSPNMGMEMFLQHANPAMNTAGTMRSMYDMLQQRFGFQSFQAMQQGQKGPNWVDYLGNLDWGRELARVAPSTRRDQPQRFMRPVRTITY